MAGPAPPHRPTRADFPGPKSISGLLIALAEVVVSKNGVVAQCGQAIWSRGIGDAMKS